jgi:alpha-glucosidase
MSQLSVEPTRVRLWNEQGAVQIGCPLPGALRVRAAPSSLLSSARHPHLPQKQSVAVVGEGALPLSVDERGETLIIRAEGVCLEVDLRRFTWRLLDPSGRLLAEAVEVGGRVSHGYPEPAWTTWLGLHTPADEAFLGFGEKTGPLDKRGLRFVFWNTDVLPHLPDTDPLYLSIPFCLGLRGGVAWGLFVDETWRMEVDIAQADPLRMTWQSAGPELDLYLLTGPHPVSVLERYTALTGRCALPPLWSLGAHQSRWGYGSAQEILEVVRGYRDRDLPLDCVHLDIDHQSRYRSLTWDRVTLPEPGVLVDACRQLGVHLVPIVDPGVRLEAEDPIYEAAKDGEFLVRSDRGDVLVGEVWPDPCVFPDFTRPEVQAFWSRLHKPLLDAGIAGFWNDMNEPAAFAVQLPERELTPPTQARGLLPKIEGPTLPWDARHGSRRHIEVHNVYGMGMAQATSRAFSEHAPGRRPFVLTRAGFAGIQRFAAVWTGDNSSTWMHLELSIPMLLGLGLSGVPFAGADVPGFLGTPTPELMVRWSQLGVFYPLLRNHSARGTPPKEPWRLGETTLGHVRRALQLRYRLLPALYTYLMDASRTGLPPLRALPLDAPGEPDALAAFDQFLFGPDLLVCPITRPGQRQRLAWIPPGTWLEVPQLERQATAHQGPSHAVVGAPLEHLPLLLRQGGAVPMTSCSLHTRSADWPELEWVVHVGPRINGQLYEDAGEGAGPWRQTRVRGGELADGLWLERTVDGSLALGRAAERLRLLGLGASVRSVEGAEFETHDDGSVTLHAPAHWRRIELVLHR